MSNRATNNFNFEDTDPSFLTSVEAANASFNSMFDGFQLPQANDDDNNRMVFPAQQAISNMAPASTNNGGQMMSPVQQSSARYPNEIFWNAPNTYLLSDGTQVTGTNRELWANFEEARRALIGLSNNGLTSFQAASVMGFPMAAKYQHATPMIQQQQQQQQGYGFSQTPGMISAALDFATPMTGYQQQQSPSPTRATPTPAPKASKKRKRAPTAPAPPMTLPPYQPSLDLGSAAAAREYMSRFDSDEATMLTIDLDDVNHVKSNLHTYAGKVYDALLHPYDKDPADLDADLKEKYTEQMESATFALQKTLSKAAKLKAAKACAVLLVDAAITLHETGVSRERFEKHMNATFRNLKPDDSFKISTDSTCSARVDAMVTMIEANKLIAKDVLDQKNYLRFAECPEAYLARKFHFMRSNTTRQDKVDERKADDEAKGITGRSNRIKRTRASKKSYAENDDDDDDEFVL